MELMKKQNEEHKVEWMQILKFKNMKASQVQ